MADLAVVEAECVWDEKTDRPAQPSGSDFDALAPTAIRVLPIRSRLSVGAVLCDRYRIERHIAGGGMGEVYLAFDLDLRELVALKTIRPEYASNELVLTRFLREVRQARSVTHPGVCRLHEFGRHQPDAANVAFFTMEFVQGKTLAQHLVNGRLGVAEALPLIAQVCAALAAAHAEGIVHCDLKAANVLLAAGADAEGQRAVLTDFGLARQADSGSEMAVGPQMAGTPDYMAPEQVLGASVSAATDVYSLGVLVFEMMTGRLPFHGETAIATAVKHATEKPPCPRSLAPNLPRAWAAAILRCLEKAPADRFATPGDFVDALRKARPVSARLRARWRPAIGMIAAMLALGGIASGLVELRPSRAVPAVAIAGLRENSGIDKPGAVAVATAPAYPMGEVSQCRENL